MIYPFLSRLPYCVEKHIVYFLVGQFEHRAWEVLSDSHFPICPWQAICVYSGPGRRKGILCSPVGMGSILGAMHTQEGTASCKYLKSNHYSSSKEQQYSVQRNTA